MKFDVLTNNSKNVRVRIIENSLLAKIAAKKLRANQVALTWGSKILLYRTSKSDFVNNTRWLRHELKHIEQFQRLGFWRFLYVYVRYTIKYGYYLNPLEIEARMAELDQDIEKNYDVLT